MDNPITGAQPIAKTAPTESAMSRKEAARASSALTGVTGQERHQLIAEAAYYRAERRSFIPGYELEDWLSAESEIEMKLNPSKSA